jgi:hypothetical protein
MTIFGILRWTDERRSRRARMLAALRKADTNAVTKHGIGGLEKRSPRTHVSLPRLKFMEDNPNVI